MQQKQGKDLTFTRQPNDQRNMFASLALSAAILFLPGAAVVSFNGETNPTAGVAEGSGSHTPDTPGGIAVIGVRSTAANYMLEFRYRVLDAEKAAALFERKTKPYLTHLDSGKVLGVPTTAKLGPLRNSNTPQAGRTYWMFFGNAARLVNTGDRVSITIGDYHSGEIIVE